MKTDLTEAIFDHCDLRRTVFIETTLNKADFTTSFNYTLDPEINKIKKAQFSLEGLQGLLSKYDIIIK
ncbi:pentapeptide repeat-containing protein [Flavobacterium sp. N501239]|nr:pentapeptide repeat-containing protein [Flavobacterium sp. N501239]